MQFLYSLLAKKTLNAITISFKFLALMGYFNRLKSDIEEDARGVNIKGYLS